MTDKKPPPLRDPAERLIAVIDIGSNSVRLVVYKGLKRAPEVVFNERVLCGLGAGIQTSGKMAEANVAMALTTLKRFSVLCRDMKVDEIDAVATAAVRDAENGPAFVAEAEKACKFKIKVLGGKKEAKLSGYGVLSGFPGAKGVAGDLGGGSLELVELKGGKVGERVSLPIGPVRLLDSPPHYTEDHVGLIRKGLASIKWLKRQKNKPFYTVGGAWRALAHLHISETGWPLHVLHNYKISGETARPFVDLIAHVGVEILRGINEVAERRRVTLPFAARILLEILDILKPPIVITSAYGIREGMMYKKLNHKMREQDPLIATSIEIGQRHARFKKHGEILSAWTQGLFKKETESERRLRQAVCHLSEISLKAHPDFKADLAFIRSLVARYVGVSHKDRAIIATALYVSYGGNLEKPVPRPALEMLGPNEVSFATSLGLVTRLAQRLTGGTARPLRKTSLYRKGDKVILEVSKKDQVLIAESVMQRLLKLAEHLSLQAEVKIS